MSRTGATSRPEFRHAMAHRFDNQRDLLFGNAIGKKREDARKVDYAQHSQAMMEADNDKLVDDLEAKVGQLKEISLGIRKEAQVSNSILDDMSNQFSKVKDMLGGTMKRLGQIMDQKGGKHMWYMVLFVLFVFFLMYMLYGSAKRGHKIVTMTQGTPADVADLDGAE
eukprot:GDKI01025489.1.p1 GENE.GDKI01025489.1~~GDKI01025489.1.p1  ORF type:complete len:167 (-),score=42.34 GDKI01025489.1:276-776(-)